MPVLTMILFVGLRLTISSRFAQIRLLPRALRNFWKSLKERNSNQDGMSGFRALCTALAATVGTGNIAGVAGAITIGCGLLDVDLCISGYDYKNGRSDTCHEV